MVSGRFCPPRLCAVLTPFFLEETLLLALLAAFLAVDERAGWQSLLAHPVFSSILVGGLLGSMEAVLHVGIVLELVWLSILPMRGMRRPDTVAGGVVGAAATAIVLRHTGDPRELFIVAAGVLTGLVVAEIGGVVQRAFNRARELRLGDFEFPESGPAATARRLVWYQMFSVGSQALAAALTVGVALPVAVALTERLTEVAAGWMVTGSQWWIDLLPAFGAAALIRSYWHRDLNRFLVLSAGVVLVVLWIR